MIYMSHEGCCEYKVNVDCQKTFNIKLLPKLIKRFVQMNCIVLYITGLFSTQTKFYEKLASVYIKLRTPPDFKSNLSESGSYSYSE